MPALAQDATSVTTTPLWDLATGARHLLISHPDSHARNDALASVLRLVDGLADTTVWADHYTLEAVKLPDDVNFGYWAAAGHDALNMLGRAVELADARRMVMEDTNRWLFQPSRRARLNLVVLDFTALSADHVDRARSPLDRLLASGRRTAMPLVAIVDPKTTPATVLDLLSRLCMNWPSQPPSDEHAAPPQLVQAAP